MVSEILYLGPVEYLVDNNLTSFYSTISIKLQGNDRTYKQTEEVESYQEYKYVLKINLFIITWRISSLSFGGKRKGRRK